VESVVEPVPHVETDVEEANETHVVTSVDVVSAIENDITSKTSEAFVRDHVVVATVGFDEPKIAEPMQDTVSCSDKTDWQAKYVALLAEYDQVDAEAKRYKALFERAMRVVDKQKQQCVFV